MAFPQDDKDRGKGKSKGDAAKPHIAPEGAERRRTPSGEIGAALRQVYDGALNEDIPPEMLDLLGKLG